MGWKRRRECERRVRRYDARAYYVFGVGKTLCTLFPFLGPESNGRNFN